MEAVKLVTPECVVKFPEYGEENITFNLCVDPTKGKEFVDKMNELNKDFDTEFFRPDKSKNEAGDLVENGLLSFKVKTKTEYGVKLFSAEGFPMEGVVGWGSRVKASITVKPYEYLGKKGLSKYLGGLQVIELKGGDVSAEGLGFTPLETVSTGAVADDDDIPF
jgi:hypothetical protein